MMQTNSIGSSLSPSVQGLLLVLGTAFAGSVATAAQLINGNKASLPIHTLLWAFVLCSEINYLLRPDILYPAFIFSAVWVVSTAVYAWFPGQIDPLQWPAVLVVLSGAVSFSVGCAFGARRVSTGQTWFPKSNGNPRTRYLLLAYCVAMVPVSIYSTMKLAGTYNVSAAMFAAARQAVVDLQSEGSTASLSPLLDRTPTIACATAVILLMEENKKWLIALSIAAALILGLFSTGRGWLLLLCGWGFITLLRARSRSFLVVSKYVITAGIIIVLALTLQTLLTKRETQQGAAGDRSAISVAIDLTADNFAGPLAGLNSIIENPSTFRDQSNNTFAPILSLLRLVGFRYEPPPPFDPFIPVPFMVNAFTAYKAFYVDFGSIGCCLALLICGSISGLFFTFAVGGNKFSTFVFCYVAYAVVFSPFQNSFILLTRYAYVFLFATAYFVCVPRFPTLTLSLSHKAYGKIEQTRRRPV